jgi:hypothetical protein
MPVARQIVLQVALRDIGQLTYIARHLTEPLRRMATDPGQTDAPATGVTGARVKLLPIR